jgi:exopolysaccharide biosynthesis polyprenyl glycosylphosphotransferase
MSEPVRRPGGLMQPALLITADLVALETAFLVTYWFRFHAGIWPAPLGVPPLPLYLLTSAVILLVFFGLFYARGLYGRVAFTFEEELAALLRGVVQGSLLVLALTFFFRRATYSRSFFGLFFLSCLVFLAAGRLVARRVLRRWRRRGVGVRRVLLVGDSPMRERVVRAARARPELGLSPVGWLDVDDDAPAVAEPAPPDSGGAPTAGGLLRLGGFADLRRVVAELGIDLVVLTLPFPRLGLVALATEELASLPVDVQLVPDLLALRTSRMRLTEAGDIPFFGVRETALSGADRIVKRIFDLVCTTIGLLLLLPCLLLLIALVRFTSRGPVFYRQARVGRDGREFHMLKFRTMRVDAEARSGPVWTVAGDSRVTPAGRWLRRLSLDELPQLWNVLRGNMSLVGPRPERQVFVEQFSRELPRYFERHQVRSGLTGWAQVNGLRGNTSIGERTLYDLYYVENWSLGLDIRILLMTVHHVLRGENAY